MSDDTVDRVDRDDSDDEELGPIDGDGDGGGGVMPRSLLSDRNAALASGLTLLAVADRNGFDESYHFGAVVALGPNGDVEFALGDAELPVYGRSSNKPMQAVAMLRAGLDLPPDLLALVCASHSGTPSHLAGVARILASVGLRDTALANTADWPLDEQSAHEAIRSGGHRTSLQMNCSGKHAGMLATCVHNGWAHDMSYLDREHPLQTGITNTIAELTVRETGHIGVDGCGAPAHVTPLVGLAQAFRAIAMAPAGDSAEHRVYRAMTAQPFMVGGPGRDVTAFMELVPGLMCKDGAQGMFAAALPDGRAVALKIADGGDRARPPVMARALALLGIDVSHAESAWRLPTLGHSRVVGHVRAAF